MNKKQREHDSKVKEAAERLPSVSREAVARAFATLYPERRASTGKAHAWCLECGHKWKPEKPSKKVCPKCHTKFTHLTEERRIEVREYFNVLDYFQGFQVVRLVMLITTYERNCKPSRYHTEVMQWWISEDGTYTTRAKGVNGFGWCADAWLIHTDMRIVKNLSPNEYSGTKARLRHELNSIHIASKRGIAPWLRMRGYRGKPTYVGPQILARLLLNPLAETLYKCKQEKLFARCNSDLEDVQRYWPQIRIAMRHNYIVKDVQMWFDHIYTVQKLGLDDRNPVYILPDNLKETHNQLNARLRRKEKRERYLQLIAEMKEAQIEYAERMSKYFNVSLYVGDIEVKPLTSVQQFYELGENLNLCVFENEYYKEPDSLIMAAYVEGEVVEVMEISLTERKVLQIHGKDHEASPYQKRIVRAMTRKQITALLKAA